MAKNYYKLTKLTGKDVGGEGYDSYSFCFTVKDLIDTSVSSKIQRLRNEQKENGIIKFIDKKITNGETPFFQPFILHYTGDIIENNEKFLLDGEYNIESEIEKDGETIIKRYMFEVLDGNGRLNSMIRLRNQYDEKIESLSIQKNSKNITEAKRRKLQEQILKIRFNKQSLENFNLVVQLYVNLTESQKKELFVAVNQGEKMNKGRLKLYDTSNPSSFIIENYIQHTEDSDLYFVVNADAKGVGHISDCRFNIPVERISIPIKFINSFINKKGLDLEENMEYIINILDIYSIVLLKYYYDNKDVLDKQCKPLLGTEGKTASYYYGNGKAMGTLKDILKESDSLEEVYKKYKNSSINL